MKRLINSFARTKRFAFWLFFMIEFLSWKNAIALTYEMPSIFFKEKTPSFNDEIEESLSVYELPLEVLKDDVLAIQKLKGHFDIKIVGYTDNNECAGSECTRLSLRRAQLIYDWMLAHGVPANQLLRPEGHGSEDAIGDNNTLVGRAKNRRVEFQWILISPS